MEALAGTAHESNEHVVLVARHSGMSQGWGVADGSDGDAPLAGLEEGLDVRPGR